MDLSRKCRDVIQSEDYQAIFEGTKLRDDQNTKGYYENERRGFRFSVGTGGAVTGMHGHIIIVDDPLNPLSAASDADLATANSWMTETLSTRKVDKDVTPTILIMQRLHQSDPTGAWLEKEGPSRRVRHICLPAEVDEGNRRTVKPRKALLQYHDGLMDPVRLPRRVLREQKKTLGPYGYAGQFEQTPTPRGGGMFKRDALIVENPPTKWKRKIRFWDKAGTRGGGAFTAGVLMGQDMDDRFWVLHVLKGQWDAGLREKIIKQTAVGDGRNVVVGIEQEPGSGGKESAQATVKNLAGFVVHVDRPVGDKVLRAEPFSAQLNNGNVSAAPGTWLADFLDELQYFPYSKYKDQVDAGSAAFAYLSGTKLRVGGL
jgi:predicted phage terminase large subunit-like protein